MRWFRLDKWKSAAKRSEHPFAGTTEGDVSLIGLFLMYFTIKYIIHRRIVLPAPCFGVRCECESASCVLELLYSI
jgi:hypothetical protein